MVVVAIAVAMAALPIPAGAVERLYSTLVYPVIQRTLTPASNVLPFAIFDVLCVAALCAFVVMLYRAVRRLGWRRGILQAGGRTIVMASIVYLAFLAAWGLNYRRVPLVEKVVFDHTRITGEAMRDFGEANAVALNRLYRKAHESPLSLDALEGSFNAALEQMRSPTIVPGRPKQTLLGGYFHEIAVAGMTDPFFLETLVAPDLLDVERPFVIAHEWAHLAGYADESEANYIAWITCRHGDALAQYSAALMMIGYASPERRGALDIGPRIDLWAIHYRYSKTNQTLRFAATRGYDTYLKANRVDKGVESYDAVVQLILGTVLDEGGYPRTEWGTRSLR